MKSEWSILLTSNTQGISHITTTLALNGKFFGGIIKGSLYVLKLAPIKLFTTFWMKWL